MSEVVGYLVELAAYAHVTPIARAIAVPDIRESADFLRIELFSEPNRLTDVSMSANIALRFESVSVWHEDHERSGVQPEQHPALCGDLNPAISQ